MPRINWSRVVLGGVLASVIWGILYAPLHPLVEVHDSLGRPVLPITPFRGATPVMTMLVVINGFVQGVATVWLYAAIRPRFGPGPKAAAVAGFAIWIVVSSVHITWVTFTAGRLTPALVPLLANLPLVVLSGMAGAWLYRE